MPSATIEQVKSLQNSLELPSARGSINKSDIKKSESDYNSPDSALPKGISFGSKYQILGITEAQGVLLSSDKIEDLGKNAKARLKEFNADDKQLSEIDEIVSSLGDPTRKVIYDRYLGLVSQREESKAAKNFPIKAVSDNLTISSELNIADSGYQSSEIFKAETLTGGDYTLANVVNEGFKHLGVNSDHQMNLMLRRVENKISEYLQSPNGKTPEPLTHLLEIINQSKLEGKRPDRGSILESIKNEIKSKGIPSDIVASMLVFLNRIDLGDGAKPTINQSISQNKEIQDKIPVTITLQDQTAANNISNLQKLKTKKQL